MDDRIRREGTRALANCAAKIGAKIYLQQSVVWVARPADGSTFDEDSPTQAEGILRSAVEGEQVAQEARERGRFCVAVLRCGWFYAADAAQTRMFGEWLSKHELPVIAGGKAI